MHDSDFHKHRCDHDRKYSRAEDVNIGGVPVASLPNSHPTVGYTVAKFAQVINKRCFHDGLYNTACDDMKVEVFILHANRVHPGVVENCFSTDILFRNRAHDYIRRRSIMIIFPITAGRT